MSRDEEVGQKDEDKFRDCEKFKVCYRFKVVMLLILKFGYRLVSSFRVYQEFWTNLDHFRVTFVHFCSEQQFCECLGN